jgi:hypothetical protein
MRLWGASTFNQVEYLHFKFRKWTMKNFLLVAAYALTPIMISTWEIAETSFANLVLIGMSLNWYAILGDTRCLM